jgi:hypothetical protein
MPEAARSGRKSRVRGLSQGRASTREVRRAKRSGCAHEFYGSRFPPCRRWPQNAVTSRRGLPLWFRHRDRTLEIVQDASQGKRTSVQRARFEAVTRARQGELLVQHDRQQRPHRTSSTRIPSSGLGEPLGPSPPRSRPRHPRPRFNHPAFPHPCPSAPRSLNKPVSHR